MPNKRALRRQRRREKFLAALVKLQIDIAHWAENELAPKLKTAGEETADFLEALIIGVFIGEAGRERTRDLGGSTAAERTGFEIGKGASAVLRIMILDGIGAMIAKQPISPWLVPLVDSALTLAKENPTAIIPSESESESETPSE
jgi:hypothetical protein